MENQLPGFWSDRLSRMFSEVQVGLDFSGGKDDLVIRPSGEDHWIAPTRKGKKTSTEEKREIAKRMRAASYSYGGITKELGVSRGYAYVLVNGKKGKASYPEW